MQKILPRKLLTRFSNPVNNPKKMGEMGISGGKIRTNNRVTPENNNCNTKKGNRENFMKTKPDPKIIIESLLKEVGKCTKEGERGLTFWIGFGIVRNRVNAEIAKTYVRLGQKQKAIQLMRYILGIRLKMADG